MDFSCVFSSCFAPGERISNARLCDGRAANGIFRGVLGSFGGARLTRETSDDLLFGGERLTIFLVFVHRITP